jgi:hypothetical protein
MTLTQRRRGFWAREIWPRRNALFWHRNVLYSVLLSAAITFVTNRWSADIALVPPTFEVVTTALVAFAALTFGGCIAGATLAIALPGDRLLATLVLNNLEVAGIKVRLSEQDGSLVPEFSEQGAPRYLDGFKSNYANLVFTFIYSAFVQLFLSAVSIVTALIVGDRRLFGCGCDWVSTVLMFSLLLTAFYSFLQLAACLRALYSIASLRDKYLRADLVKTVDGGSPSE